uniref:disease resistance protein RPV1-like n=1 Tax=Erigeron canadensis TaxID=72917 RepID=UPI001CB94546|nr:disease resistance protein RPV1-like [Erigeron canadensis]
MVVLGELEQGSSLSTPHDRRYDVFLSFRGVDTRYSFVDHLYNALLDANITTFLDDDDDDEIETGEDLKPALESAIESSRASIIVLSKNYATSTWCLDELASILEQRRTSDHIVIPIFYHVKPADVRKQQGSFGDAMRQHKHKMEEEKNAERKSQWAKKIKKWEKALAQVADLTGIDVKARKETEIIEKVITNIHRRLGAPLSNTLPHLIGMKDHIYLITSWLTDGLSSHTAKILTVLGMGGIGKTSLAKYVFHLHSHTFDKSSFIEGINRRCTEQFNGLLDVQKQLYGDISKTRSVQVHDVSVYTSKIGNALARKKVLLVMDDINSIDQLDALLGNKDFHPGSKIIITTRDESLTERCKLFKSNVKPNHIKYFLKGLDETASLKLLCAHAFMCNYPKIGYEKVSRKIVKYCDGHPLALEVLGKSLHNREVGYWEDCIEGIKKEPHSHIEKALQMSFDSLTSKNDKELFKHIACFFVGKDRDLCETILQACDFNTISGITNLVEKCLLSIGRNNTLTMHQLLQEMGRDVVRQESPDKPWKRSRLWCNEESIKVLKRKKNMENILGLTFDMRMLEKEKLRCSFELKTDVLSKMDNLMLLQLNYVQMYGFYGHFPEEIRWLCMHGFPLKSIPLELPMENFVVLDMSYSNIESFGLFYDNLQQHESRQKWNGSCLKDRRLLGSLKILNLSFCEQLRGVSSFFELPALERLIVRNCIKLMEISETIEQCVELVFIDMSYCHNLEKLPTSLGKLKKVKTLLLDGCNFQESRIEVMDKDSPGMLNEKDMDTRLKTSSSALVESIPRDLKSCVISLPCSLVRLSLKGSKLSSEFFPRDFSSLLMLKILHLDDNPIVSMPTCVGSLPRLETLTMYDCKLLTTIEHPPCTLRVLSHNSYSNSHHGSKIFLRKILFKPEMSQLQLLLDLELTAASSTEVGGIIKIQHIADVEENVLCNLGWNNLELGQKRYVGVYELSSGSEGSQSQSKMYYEFGIFSTFFWGEVIPHWITRRVTRTAISFSIPSSSNELRGLNFCYVQTSKSSIGAFQLPGNMLFYLPLIKNEMEGGDQVTITVTEDYGQVTRVCGVSFMYDDGSIKEQDALGYYKSWNHIIGGDLSAFQKHMSHLELSPRKKGDILGRTPK